MQILRAAEAKNYQAERPDPIEIFACSRASCGMRALKRTALIADGSRMYCLWRPSGSAPPSTRCPPRNTHTHTQVVDGLPCSHSPAGTRVVGSLPTAEWMRRGAHIRHPRPRPSRATHVPSRGCASCCLGPPPRTARSTCACTCPAGPLSAGFSAYSTCWLLFGRGLRFELSTALRIALGRSDAPRADRVRPRRTAPRQTDAPR
jgi:hypothetical protein